MWSSFMCKWLFFFYLYCFLGWCFESAYVSMRMRHPVNRGFMRGPFLPIYGSGALMMLVVSAPFQDNIPLTYLAGCVGATLLEYVTGTVTEKLFQVRYWDYSGKFMNVQGQICLSSTLAWGVLTILMTEVIHHPIAALVDGMPSGLLAGLTLVLTVYVVTDFGLSFRAALDMRDVLDRLQQAKEEMEHMQKRMDVLIAVADQTLNQEREELHRKFRLLNERRRQLGNLSDFYRRRLLLDNPGMISSRFKGAMEDLKASAREYVKEHMSEYQTKSRKD